MKSLLFVIFPLLISITVGLPIKDHDIDEILQRVNAWRHLNAYQGAGGKHESNYNTQQGKRAPADMERTYDYYTSALSSYEPSQNLESLDRDFLERLLAARSMYGDRNGFAEPEGNEYGKRNFDEIDRVAFGGLMKKAPGFGNSHHDLRDSLYKKRNFDEIDRSGFTNLRAKRNFDEIDRSGFTNLRAKRNFDEIDSGTGFKGLKRRQLESSLQ